MTWRAGFLLGSRETLLETKDGGRTWSPRTVAAAQDEGFNYRFTSVSFAGNEGWIVGKPAILLHSGDGGTNWDRIPLSAKLPGNPILVSALSGKPGQAEMVTDQVGSPQLPNHNRPSMTNEVFLYFWEVTDNATKWGRIPISAKLPGNTVLISKLSSNRDSF